MQDTVVETDAQAQPEGGSVSQPAVSHASSGNNLVPTLRIFALGMVAVAFGFLVNNYLDYWRDWPGLGAVFADLGWFGVEPLEPALDGTALALAWLQVLIYLVPIGAIAVFVLRTPARALHEDSEVLSALVNYIVRAAFWSVLLIGVVDAVISFLRVEGLLVATVGADLTQDLGRSAFRGSYVHYPLMFLSLVIAYFSRSLGFTWLALLIVVAEAQIVMARFVFSYEQAFMGDLVRFWYGALFLFASAYTLIEEGHVRVDIFYASFSERGKAWTNCLGSVFLGMPLCWTILAMGLRGKSTSINGPLLSFEVSQSGYGLYIKYLFAAFLLVYAISMLIQFASYLLRNVAVLLHEPGYRPDMAERIDI